MNSKQRVTFFLVLSFLSGFFAALGSILGGSLAGQNGLFVGATTAGIFGIIITIVAFNKLGWIVPSRIKQAIAGAVIGFLFAAPIAVFGSLTFNNPIVPILSTALVGLGALLGLNKT